METITSEKQLSDADIHFLIDHGMPMDFAIQAQYLPHLTKVQRRLPQTPARLCKVSISVEDDLLNWPMRPLANHCLADQFAAIQPNGRKWLCRSKF